ncbi:transcription initiation factor iiic tfiiic polypeptide 6-related [Holotrichia oblita]|uniref:Transcription initiation factor iiic tfiiic polypeptide 6-related n=1 Tax=Holotrichia oblita TaxID=644536 RepID=A0ACB9SVD4_HOLOL|nr:transcription initiation factor iiic tfiiic polypeptide 6-related [Holotrichia oblita]
MDDKEIYLFLDLNDKLDQNFFQKSDIFFKMVNINSDYPLVQVGNFVFEGRYEDFLGTKVFFMEDKNHVPSDNVFVREALIHLKYVTKTAKIMQLKWRKLPTNVVSVDSKECLDLQFKESYNEVLEKFEKGALDIKDIIYDLKNQESAMLVNSSNEKSETKDVINVENANQVDNNHKDEETENDKYKILRNLAQTPVKQKEIQKVYEVNKENLAQPGNVENFAVLHQLFLQNVTLKKVNIIENEGDFNKYVDIEKSIKDGVIYKSENGEITDEQKILLLAESNFDNFTLPMKLAYLTEQLEEYKRIRNMKRAAILQEVDEFGRTFKDRYKLLKTITREIWYYVYSNCEDYI